MAVSVKFGATSAENIVVVSDTEVTCDSPAGTAGTVKIAVTTAGGTADNKPDFEYTSA